MKWDIDILREGPNFDRLYHKLKVLLLFLLLLSDSIVVALIFQLRQ